MVTNYKEIETTIGVPGVSYANFIYHNSNQSISITNLDILNHASSNASKDHSK